MNLRDFLPLAVRLAAGTDEAEWRTAVSRAYYAAFHAARQFLFAAHFQPPQGDRAHAYIWRRLAGCSELGLDRAGNLLADLRRRRNYADYDDWRRFTQSLTRSAVMDAEAIIRALDAAAADPTLPAAVTAIRTFERDVLKEVTWVP